MKIAIIDYGAGNVRSLQFALERLGVQGQLTADPQVIQKADKVIFPGQGEAKSAMRKLKSVGVDRLLPQLKQPVLGICLGMQMLLDRSEEFGINEGLGIIEGENIPIASQPLSSDRKKIPHIGWNGLQKPDAAMSWEGTILEATPLETPVYFVHSFMAAARKKTAWLSEVTYCGVKIPAVIKLDNTYGCQFHPEKSGPCGLAIIRSFLNLAR